MVNSDEDYAPSSDDDRKLPALPSQVLNRVNDKQLAGEDAQVPAQEKKTSKSTRICFPDNLRAVAQMLVHVKKQIYAYDIDRNLSLRVIRASLQLQKRYLEKT